MKGHSMKTVICVAACAGLAFAGAVSAHHSFAMYDQNKKTTLIGTVTDWQWTNPHTELFVMVTDEDGKAVSTPEVWRIESESPEVMRGGYKLRRDLIKVGDKVTVTLHPLRDSSKGGHLISVTLPDGTLFANTNR
jgi:Family of unknown function (DUF6152)